MATTHALVALTSSTPVKLTPAVDTHAGLDFTVQNPNNSGYVYIGAADVSTTNYGYRILPNHAISFELPPKDHLYAVASTSLNAAVISIGLESKN